MLFLDSSVDTQSKIGYGAYLLLSEYGLSLDLLKSSVKVKRFEQTSSTKLELQTLLWALCDIEIEGCTVNIYTDSKNIVDLPDRRERLEKTDYRSRKKRCLKHHKLYQAFFRLTDQIDCRFVKVRGHQPSNQKKDIDRLFTFVDKASRNALRGNNRKLS